jgi:hypothetical protein
MRSYPFPLAPVLALAFAFPLYAASKPNPKPAPQNQPKKIWTNDDIAQLRATGLISVVGENIQQAQGPSTVESAPTFAVYTSRLEDPQWYADTAADLQAELSKREDALRGEQTAIAQAANGITQPGIAMDKPTIGVTPDAAVAVLQAQVDEVQSKLDALSDLARQHNIPPGALRE